MSFIRFLLGNVVVEVYWVGLQFGQCTVHWNKTDYGVQSDSESKLLNNLIYM